MEKKTPKRSRILRLLLDLALLYAVMMAGAPYGCAWLDRTQAMTALYQGLGMEMQRWAEAHETYLPPLDPEPGRLMFADDTLYYPDYEPVAWFWTYPGDQPNPAARPGEDARRHAAIDDHSYFYLGYLVCDSAQAKAFARAYADRAAEGGAFDTDLIVPQGQGNFGTGRIHRLRTNLAPIAPKDLDETQRAVLLSKIPIIVQRPKKTCLGEGGIVLYLDNHVEYLPYPGPFPMTPECIDALKQIDRLGDPP